MQSITTPDQSCNSPEEYTVYFTDSVCIWTVMMKRVRKIPVWASSKYPTLFMLLDPQANA